MNFDAAQSGKIPEGPEQILVIFGAAVLAVQSTERILHFCLVYILQTEGDLNIETLRKYETSKKTLGQLLASLREKIGLHERFDEYLSEYLTKRNTLVHNVTRVEGGWDISSKPGRDSAKQFLHRVMVLDAIIQRVLVGLIRSWIASNPFPTLPAFPDLSPASYVPEQVLDEIFFAKD